MFMVNRLTDKIFNRSILMVKKRLNHLNFSQMTGRLSDFFCVAFEHINHITEPT